MRVDWVELSELCIQDRRPITPESKEASLLPYLGLENIEAQTGHIISLADPLSAKGLCFRFTAKHVLYAKLRPYLNKVALPACDGKCSTEAIPLKPIGNISREYIALLLKRPQTVDFVMSEITGSRMPRADVGKLLSLRVPLVSGEDQQKLCRLVNEVEAQVASALISVKAQQEALASLRQELRANPIGLLHV